MDTFAKNQKKLIEFKLNDLVVNTTQKCVMDASGPTDASELKQQLERCFRIDLIHK